MENLPDYVAKEGWMEKKGGSRRNWSKRWFVLKGSFLYYYESDKAAHKDNAKEKGIISLTDCIIQQIEHHSRPFCFEISHAERERKYEVSCAGAEEKNEWMEVVATAAMGPVNAPVTIASFYERLGVEDNSAMKDVTRAFRKLAMKNHPDKGGDLNDFKAITDAYEVIKSCKEAEVSEAEDFESYKVAMVRGTRGLGLSLEDFGDPPLNRVVVSAIVEGKPAHQTGQIAEQDILIEIDGHGVRGLPFDTVLKYLKGVGKPNIEMAFLRKKDGVEDFDIHNTDPGADFVPMQAHESAPSDPSWDQAAAAPAPRKPDRRTSWIAKSMQAELETKQEAMEMMAVYEEEEEAEEQQAERDDAEMSALTQTVKGAPVNADIEWYKAQFEKDREAIHKLKEKVKQLQGAARSSDRHQVALDGRPAGWDVVPPQMNTQFKAVEVKRLKRAFREFDVDCDGVINEQELSAMFYDLRIAVDIDGNGEDVVRDLLRKHDTNGNNVIEFGEFCSIMLSVRNGDKPDLLGHAIQKAASGGGGGGASNGMPRLQKKKSGFRQMQHRTSTMHLSNYGGGAAASSNVNFAATLRGDDSHDHSFSAAKKMAARANKPKAATMRRAQPAAQAPMQAASPPPAGSPMVSNDFVSRIERLKQKKSASTSPTAASQAPQTRTFAQARQDFAAKHNL
jgi:hypothetical protein